MNVQEMMETIPERYPEAKLITEWEGEKFDLFQVKLPNGWMISAGYSIGHYCDNSRRFVEAVRSSGESRKTFELIDLETVEIAIFTPSNEWYIAEGMDVSSDGRTAVLGWQNSEQLFRIIDYISKKE